jgi:rod shape-determining protein MreC
MDTLITRYRNVTILVAVLFAQVLGLAVQVKRSSENQSSRLIRIWAISAVTPLEKAILGIQSGVGNLWRGYIYLRGVRQENRELKAQIEKLRIEQVRLNQDAEQGRRLQALLGFKEQFISRTVAAQVIGSSGSEQSRSIYIDKGSHDGIDKDMAVITADGVVGKVLRVFNSTSQVLLINDQSSGVGAILEKSRLQGVLRGTPVGEVVLEKVMADEQLQSGDRVLTSGGDQIFPKGLPVGTVEKVTKGNELFLNIRIRPFANLSRLEEVLVITQKAEKAPAVAEAGTTRAVDILSQRLPSVPDKPPEEPQKPAAASDKPTGQPPSAKPNKPEIAGATNPKLPGTAKPPANVESAPKAAVGPVAVKPATATKPPITPKPKPVTIEVAQPTTEPQTAAPQQNPERTPAEPPPTEEKPH